MLLEEIKGGVFLQLPRPYGCVLRRLDAFAQGLLASWFLSDKRRRVKCVYVLKAVGLPGWLRGKGLFAV
jgi:hypothetical protein